MPKYPADWYTKTRKLIWSHNQFWAVGRLATKLGEVFPGQDNAAFRAKFSKAMMKDTNLAETLKHLATLWKAEGRKRDDWMVLKPYVLECWGVLRPKKD